MATQAQIKQRVRECIELAEELYGFDVDYNDIDITFKGRGQAAASAGCKINRLTGKRHSFSLKFSTESAALDSAEMLDDTVPHEVAHLVCYWNESLGKNHDYGWVRVCKALGGTGARTHSQTLTKAKYRKQYLYRTDNGDERIVKSAAKHNKIQRGARYQVRATREWYGKENFVRIISAEEHRQEHMKQVTEYRNAAGAPAAPASQKRPAPKKKPTSHKRPARRAARRSPGTPSKKDRAQNIYNATPDKARCITRFMDELDMTKAGATTYYYNCKKLA